MKIDARSADRFAQNPDPKVRAVLLYGPDAGLVRERAEKLTQSVVEDPKDPFRVAEISSSLLKEDPARLNDEAAAISFGGGRRVLRVLDPEDGLTGLFEAFLHDLPGDALVVVEAGDLPPRSKLRGLFEKAETGAALACYRDEERNLEQVIRESLKQEGLTCAPDALTFLRDHLGSNRQVTRRELEKLATYKGRGGGEVLLEDALACVGDSAFLTLDDLSQAVADGNLPALERILEKAYAEGANAISILRAVSGHFMRLASARSHMDAGKSAEQAMSQLRPPVFFKLKGPFGRQLSLWGSPALGQAVNRLLEAELACKRTGAPADLLTSRALFEIAARAPKRGR
jgi:DNA polymerase-3 subunit delta